jgi:Phosphoheptose isomerase
MRNLVDELIERYPILEPGRKDITEAFHILLNCFRGQGKLLIAGNGGSAADAEHIVGELMKGFVLKREIDDNLKDKLRNVDYDMGNKLSRKLQLSLPAIALSNHSSLNTAFSNDVDGQLCFAQQVLGYGKEGDVFLGISTSGNSANVLYAAIVAKAQGMKVIGLTGRGGGRLADMADVVVAVDEKETYKVQELHLPIYHCLCLMVESEMFG